MLTNICCEGMDEAGKKTVASYLSYLSLHKYITYEYGPMSCIARSKLENKRPKYDLTPYQKFVFVYLICDEEDWNARRTDADESIGDYWQQMMAYNNVAKDFKYNGFRVLEFNTSLMTPYNIAKEVLKYMKEQNSSESKLSKQS